MGQRVATDGGVVDVERVTLYRAPTTVVDADAVAAWLDDRVDASVEVEERLLGLLIDRDADGDADADGDGAEAEDVAEGGGDSEDDPAEALARAFAEARVLSPYDRETGNTMLGIVRYEERALAHPERAGGVIYDGLEVQDALRERLASPLEHLHVPLLDRVIGTWGDHDGRWHKRVNVLGQPAIVSVPGLYEAPAKPEAYYREQQRHALLTGDTPPREVLEEEVEGEFLVADDPRTTDAIGGYVLQAYHYLATGEAFCEDERCQLHNAHRQPGLVRAQLRDPEFCEEHADLYG